MGNKIIVNQRETGKTTYLLNEVDKHWKSNYNVIVMDSATEHVDKSLLKKVMRTYKDAELYEIEDTDKVVLSNNSYNYFLENYTTFFPYNELVNTSGRIKCFDLSYFLEKGHDVFERTGDEKLYKYYRNLYNMLSQQIALSLILCERDNLISDCVVIMDEIEFPIFSYDISQLQKDISFIASVHPENSFGSFYNSFEVLQDFKPYIKRRKL